MQDRHPQQLAFHTVNRAFSRIGKSDGSDTSDGSDISDQDFRHLTGMPELGTGGWSLIN
jgi:hypothetical protein